MSYCNSYRYSARGYILGPPFLPNWHIFLSRKVVTRRKFGAGIICHSMLRCGSRIACLQLPTDNLCFRNVPFNDRYPCRPQHPTSLLPVLLIAFSYRNAAAARPPWRIASIICPLFTSRDRIESCQCRFIVVCWGHGLNHRRHLRARPPHLNYI